MIIILIIITIVMIIIIIIMVIIIVKMIIIVIIIIIILTTTCICLCLQPVITASWVGTASRPVTVSTESPVTGSLGSVAARLASRETDVTNVSTRKQRSAL